MTTYHDLNHHAPIPTLKAATSKRVHELGDDGAAKCVKGPLSPERHVCLRHEEHGDTHRTETIEYFSGRK